MIIKWWHLLLIAVFGLLVGFGYGRFLVPDRTESRELEFELSQAKQQLRAVSFENETRKQNTKRETVVVYGKNGKPKTKTTKTETQVDQNKQAAQVVEVVKTVDVVRFVDRVKIVEKAPPMNRLGLLGELSSTGVPAVGLQFQRRLVGPLILSLGGTGTLPRPARRFEIRGQVGVHLEF